MERSPRIEELKERISILSTLTARNKYGDVIKVQDDVRCWGITRKRKDNVRVATFESAGEKGKNVHILFF